MKDFSQAIIEELAAVGSPQKAKHFSCFFKTGKGEYGEGDLFVGVVVPHARTIAQRYIEADDDSLHELLLSPYHEHRLTALLILTYRFEKSKNEKEKEAIVDFYLKHVDAINNWDLVDLTCYKFLGRWLYDKDRTLLYDWARTDHLWKQRIAMVSCMYFVKKGEFKDCFAIADILQHHPHDLIHKAVGWLLREAGKKDEQTLVAYLLPRYRQMPRTMLRYAIERFSPTDRQAFLKGTKRP